MTCLEVTCPQLISPAIPETTVRQQNRPNHPTTSCYRSVTILHNESLKKNLMLPLRDSG